jgi:hypothetical protein
MEDRELVTALRPPDAFGELVEKSRRTAVWISREERVLSVVAYRRKPAKARRLKMSLNTRMDMFL